MTVCTCIYVCMCGLPSPKWHRGRPPAPGLALRETLNYRLEGMVHGLNNVIFNSILYKIFYEKIQTWARFWISHLYMSLTFKTKNIEWGICTIHMKRKIVAIIQARLTSKRFPNKVLKKVSGLAVIEIILKRLSLSKKEPNYWITKTPCKKSNKKRYFTSRKQMKICLYRKEYFMKCISK